MARALVPQPIVDDALIQEITRKIVERFHPRRVILFGSRARGDHRPDSDVDLFVEMESTENPIRRAQTIGSLFSDRWWGMDLIVMTPEEVRASEASSASVIPTIEREGKLLFTAVHGT